jgi:CDGSH-type Zn-finger protein
MAEVTPLPNGPLKIDGAKLLDAAGNVVKDGEPLFLCRCGQSSNQPFCDATHKKVGFQAE